jgi:Zn-dependent alcohol dehydrogenase
VNAQNSDPVESIRAIVPRGVSYAFEAVGSEEALGQAYRATGRGGTTISIGLAHPAKQFSVQALSLVAEERTVKGSYMGSSVPARDIPRLLSLYQAGLLPADLLVSRTLPLKDINSGLEALRRGEVVRQLVDPKR